MVPPIMDTIRSLMSTATHWLKVVLKSENVSCSTKNMYQLSWQRHKINFKAFLYGFEKTGNIISDINARLRSHARREGLRNSWCYCETCSRLRIKKKGQEAGRLAGISAAEQFLAAIDSLIQDLRASVRT